MVQTYLFKIKKSDVKITSLLLRDYAVFLIKKIIYSSNFWFIIQAFFRTLIVSFFKLIAILKKKWKGQI